MATIKGVTVVPAYNGIEPQVHVALEEFFKNGSSVQSSGLSLRETDLLVDALIDAMLTARRMEERIGGAA